MSSDPPIKDLDLKPWPTYIIFLLVFQHINCRVRIRLLSSLNAPPPYHAGQDPDPGITLDTDSVDPDSKYRITCMVCMYNSEYVLYIYCTVYCSK